MKRLFKWLAVLAGLVVVLVLGFAGFVMATWEKDYSAVPKPAIAASSDPAVIKQGEYVFHAVAHCAICHGGPKSITAKRGDRFPQEGGYVFKAGPFGTFVARNLTADRETGLGAQSDADIARAIRSAVDHDGRFIPFMKVAVGGIADEDLTALISYMRTLPPVKRQEQPEVWGPIGKLLAATNFAPGPQAAHAPYVAASDEPSVARGAYLANGPAACRVCHTKHDPMQGFAEIAPPFSGGDVESDDTDPASEFEAPNLTPSTASSPIAAWDEATWVTRFRGGIAFPGSHMPWESYAEMTDADVRSLYRYVRSLTPVGTPPAPTHRPKGWKPASS